MIQELQNKHYVVVDDNLHALELVGDYLKSFGATRIHSFNDANTALDHLRKNAVDYLICDWEMPGMTGIELLQEIRKSPEFDHVIFIMITSPGSMEQMKVVGAGLNHVDSYLIKPFKSRPFLEKLLETGIEHRLRSKKTVIVADDDEAVRSLVSDILESMGFAPILQYESADLAYPALESRIDEVAVVVSDWEMPGMTGIEFLQKVRTNPNTANVPFVIITSQTSLETLKIRQAALASVDSYLVKPFKVDTFKTRIQSLLASERLETFLRLQLNLGQEALATDELVEAKHHFDLARQRAPDRIEPLLGLARVELSRRPTRDLKEAARYLQEAIQLQPKSPEAYIELALAYEMGLAPERGTHTLREAIMHCPPNAEVLYQMGRLLFKRGKTAEAIQFLQKTLVLEPEHQNAQALLSDLTAGAKES
jgi:two-component system chemotaxis response regulator CheY